MRDSRRSARTRTSSQRVSTTSRPNVRARPTPSIVTSASAKRIRDKIPVLALKRPNMLHLVEMLIDAMLTDKRRADRLT